MLVHNFKYRHINDVLSIEATTESNSSAYLHLFRSIEKEGKFHSLLWDKRHVPVLIS